MPLGLLRINTKTKAMGTLSNTQISIKLNKSNSKLWNVRRRFR